jgi:hypothetical protein
MCILAITLKKLHITITIENMFHTVAFELASPKLHETYYIIWLITLYVKTLSRAFFTKKF